MTQADDAILLVHGGPHDDETIPLGAKVTMGRGLKDDVVVEESTVSRLHAEVVQTENEYAIDDKSSANGTFVNDVKIAERRVLGDRDTIRLGNGGKISFVFHAPGARTLVITLSPAQQEAPTQAVDVPPRATDDEPYEGTVRLRVEGQMNAVLFFTDRLNKKPELRILRLTKNRRGDTEIWLALREPLSLQEMLSSVQGVELVSPTEGRNLSPDSQDRPLTVTLKTPELPDEPEWRTCVYCREVIQPATTVCPRCRKTQA